MSMKPICAREEPVERDFLGGVEDATRAAAGFHDLPRDPSAG
jgi:hypothetical protein